MTHFKLESSDLLRRVDSLVGGLVCGIAAFGVCTLASGHPWKTVVPLAFCAVLLAVAFVFGTRAGILGTLIATLVFAAVLFAPLGSIRVTNAAARSNLGWMLLIGLSFSLLFAPPTSGLHRR